MTGTLEQKDGLIDRYLNNKLNDVERAAFELMMIEDAELFDRVQLLDSFKRALTEESAALTARRELFALPFSAWVQQPMSLAASVLVIGLGLQVVYDAVATRSAETGNVGIGATFLVEATRGAGRETLTGAPPYLFQIDAGPGAANTLVAVALRATDGAELMQVDDLRVDANGWARLVYNDKLSGDYTLELARADYATVQTFDVTISD